MEEVQMQISLLRCEMTMREARTDNNKGEIRGALSTAQRTVKLSVASVEMTDFGVGIRRRGNCKNNGDHQSLRPSGFAPAFGRVEAHFARVLWPD
jgi:hypothetical protein